MDRNKTHARVSKMVQMAVLIAIIFILTYANIGYITLGPIAFTIVQIPVIIGAILMGPGSGALLGFVFGLTSFLKALEGVEIVAATIIAQNIFLYVVIAFVPRILMGWLTGLIFKGLRGAEKRLAFGSDYNTDVSEVSGFRKVLKGRYLSYALTGFIGSMLNTVFYLSALFFLVKDILASVYDIEVGAVGAMVMGVATSAGIVEAVASMIIVTALAKAFEAMFRSRKKA